MNDIAALNDFFQKYSNDEVEDIYFTLGHSKVSVQSKTLRPPQTIANARVESEQKRDSKFTQHHKKNEPRYNLVESKENRSTMYYNSLVYKIKVFLPNVSKDEIEITLKEGSTTVETKEYCLQLSFSRKIRLQTSTCTWDAPSGTLILCLPTQASMY